MGGWEDCRRPQPGPPARGEAARAGSSRALLAAPARHRARLITKQMEAKQPLPKIVGDLFVAISEEPQLNLKGRAKV